jgi:hypothetical protein
VSDFELAATDVLQRLRTSLAGVIAGVPGRVSKPAELRRALKIDMNVSCKVFRVVNASGSMAAGPHVPGLSALRIFLKAARKAGVRDALVDAAAESVAAFDRLVTSHAGDRTAFDSMVSSLADTDDVAQITLQHRRNAYRSQRHIFGFHARAQFKLVVTGPSEAGDRLDFAQIKGLLALRRLRPNTPLIVSQVYATDDRGAVCDVGREPIDPVADQPYGLSLLREFCSQPLPDYRTVETAAGTVHSQLLGNGMGNKAAIDYVEGYVSRAACPRYREEIHGVLGNVAQVRLPCEVLLLDMLIREDTFGQLTPETLACADHLGEFTSPNLSEEWQRLDLHEKASYLGKGPDVLFTPDVPRYPELGRHVLDRLGWGDKRFDVYRLRVEYPVLPSTVVMQINLPEPPPSK